MINSMIKTVLQNITIKDILEAINKKYGTKPALRIKTKDGSLKEISYVKLGHRVVSASSALISLGIKKGDRVAILSENRPEWALAYFGIVSCAGVVVPIDVKLSNKEIQFIMNDSEVKCVFVSLKYLHVIDDLKSVLPHLENIILFDKSERKDVMLLKNLSRHRGKERGRSVYPQDTSLIVYTSGTTGVAKGVEISYKNLLFQVLAFSEIIQCTTRDNLLSILPLNHMFEITGGLIVPLYGGACITYPDTLKTTSLLPLMKETKTTAMICVPLVLKMIHGGIMKKITKLPPARQKAFRASLAFSKAMLKLNIRVGKLLFKPIHEEFGGCLRAFISGGAPLGRDVELDLNALGFRVLEGYGLTETAPAISINTYKENKFGSVGKPLPGVEVKILKKSKFSREGEILTRGPHVMKGYFNNPSKTKEVLKSGWLHTGDVGYLDRESFLYISGRLKNLIALGTGKKVFPEEVEAVMEKSPCIKEISVLGRTATRGLRKGHEEVYAVIVPDLDSFEEGERSDKENIEKKISSELARLSGNLAAYKRIADFQVRFEELPRTVTKKIKRKAVREMVYLNKNQ
ncbi:MAG: AMP-binding protein [Candidatus Omnitrophota bacterium]